MDNQLETALREEIAQLKKYIQDHNIQPTNSEYDLDTVQNTSEHLLVVDDNLINLQMITTRLKNAGYAITSETSGQTALQTLTTERFDLILLDLMMPGMTGLEVLKEIRTHFTVSELPVMIVTARDQSQDMVEALDLGANDYIVKPIDFPVMLARIQTHLNLKRAQMALKSLQKELKNRIENRTQELQQTNNRLEIEITDRLRAEKALEENGRRLQALSHRLVQIQEEERHHIARELHDEIGQVLTTVKLNLQMIQRQFDNAPQNHLLDDSINTVDHAIQQVRDLSVNLRPSILDDLGLVSALKWYVNRQAQRLTTNITLKVNDILQRPHPETEIACFRVVQEALTNIVRHANASNISIRLSPQTDHLLLEVEDNGIGFDVDVALSKASRGGSLGLLGMQERIELVGGRFSINSKQGQGTRITCQFPLHQTNPVKQEAS